MNRAAKRQNLLEYQEWIAKGIEKAIPKSINWSALYAVKQGPSEFLDRLKDTMHRSTPLDPESDIGIQQLVSSFLGQSTSDVRHKLQKLRCTEGRNLEILLHERVESVQ